MAGRVRHEARCMRMRARTCTQACVHPCAQVHANGMRSHTHTQMLTCARMQARTHARTHTLTHATNPRRSLHCPALHYTRLVRWRDRCANASPIAVGLQHLVRSVLFRVPQVPWTGESPWTWREECPWSTLGCPRGGYSWVSSAQTAPLCSARPPQPSSPLWSTPTLAALSR